MNKPLRLTNEQRDKYFELINGLFSKEDPTLTILNIRWFEACFRFVAPAVAKHYQEHHQSSTESFAKFMVLQKLIYDIEREHPVDVLYDIWKNPKDYRVDL